MTRNMVFIGKLEGRIKWGGLAGGLLVVMRSVVAGERRRAGRRGCGTEGVVAEGTDIMTAAPHTSSLQA